MELGLRGKKVIINGGSRGIGRAALDIYAAEGCDIAFFSRTRSASTRPSPRCPSPAARSSATPST